MMMIRRPPTCIGVTLPAPPMPCLKPGMTPVSGNDAGVPPRAQDESNCLPVAYSTPAYCTLTVEVGFATAPLPTTVSAHSSAAAGLLDFEITFGSCFRLVAWPTVTP